MNRLILMLAMLAAAIPPVLAEEEEWVSRHGNCYEWEATWNVKQDRSGVWVGQIDLDPVGGPCSKRSRGVPHTNEGRAVIVGRDFFARRTTNASACQLHGFIREEGVSGYEICTGTTKPLPFALRFAPRRPDDRPLE